MIGRLKAFTTGFIAGILVAPRSGRASRRLLIERINEFFEMGTEYLEDLEEELAVRRDEKPQESGQDRVEDEEAAGGLDTDID
jgi:gas vesicle protein